MRVVAITPIWPNRLEPTRATYNAQQFRELARRVELRVVNSVLYFPLAGRTGVPKRAAVVAPLPKKDVLEGVPTWHARQPYLPKIGNAVAVPLAIAALTPYLAHVRWADVVLGTWAYPDGCAAIALARLFGKACVVKVHGSDLNVIARLPAARRILQEALPRADRAVAVSRALGRELEGLGVDPARVAVVPNGVDAEVFRIRDKAAERRALGLPTEGRLVVFVGRLEPAKGIAELLEAFAAVRGRRPDVRLAMLGQGELRRDVDAARARLGDGAIVAPGERPLEEIARWMGAADVVALPSWREGTPNVLLEALSSGRPCVGSDVGGIPDVLADPGSGFVHPARDVSALAGRLGEALDRTWDPEKVRATGAGSWSESAARLFEVLSSALEFHTEVRPRGGRRPEGPEREESRR